jgi:hypothetical protein
MKITRYIKHPKGARLGYIYAESEIAHYRRLTLFEKDGRRWLTFPAVKTGEKNDKGYDIYVPYWELKDSKTAQNFFNQILNALDKWIDEGNEPEEPEEFLENNEVSARTYGQAVNNYQEERTPF